jgi:hypothetical protein
MPDIVRTTRLADWLLYGKGGQRAIVRRWINEARGHAPVIDRWN